MREFIREIATRTGMSEDHAREFLKAVLSGITETLGREGMLRLVDFGTFEVRRRAPRACRNPRTGERIMIPARNHVGFRPASALLERVDLAASEWFDQGQEPPKLEEL